jgi:Zn-dependent M16 (insulinase) family peptidase
MEAVIKELVNVILNASINNSGALSSSLSGLLDGKAINIDNLKQNLSDQAQQKVSDEIDKAKQKLMQDSGVPEGSNELLNQKTDETVNKLKEMFNKE